MTRAAAAYERARVEAEQHGVAGERATAQAQRAFVLAFTDPARADDELELAQQLLTGLDLRATTFTTEIAALVRDAGCARDVEDRARRLRTDIRVAGLASTEATLDLALCFHHAVQDERAALATTIARLRERTHSGDYAYYTDLTHFMAGLPLPAPSPARWLDTEQETATAGTPWSPPDANTCAPGHRPVPLLAGNGRRVRHGRRGGPLQGYGSGESSASTGIPAYETGKQFGQCRVDGALLGGKTVHPRRQAVDLLVQVSDQSGQTFDLVVQVPNLLIKVADLEAHRGQVALDDAELAVVLLRGVFVAAGQRGNLALSDGVFRHGLGSRKSCSGQAAPPIVAETTEGR
ncbi:hypothetical protein [Streptomyces sp. NPDC056987]|uniref:hypothetical protein n=1 Tax=Streptomyces sp. NPDC056987 TaxID=3345988 RepID=UPI0036370AB1